MKEKMLGLLLTMTVLTIGVLNYKQVWAEGSQENQSGTLLSAISQSKVSIIDGIKQATKGTEVPISAKYELDEKGKLSLSIYTAQKGLSVAPEDNSFNEISGSPELAAWQPSTEVIKDSGDLKDAKDQLAVLSKTKVSLADIAQKAGQDGTVMSVIPQANHNDIEAKVAKDGKVIERHYDVASGNEVKMEGKDTDEGKDNDEGRY